MSSTPTVRNLDETVKQKLRLQAARDILARNVMGKEDSLQANLTTEGADSGKGKFDHLVGIWKGRGTTDELMRATRGED